MQKLEIKKIKNMIFTALLLDFSIKTDTVKCSSCEVDKWKVAAYSKIDTFFAVAWPKQSYE